MSERVINKVTSTSTNLPPVLLDLTGDTVNEKNLERNQTAHNSGGQKITGALAIEEAEAWARGTKNGTPVPPTDETYQNNSRYYSIVSGSIMRMAGQQAIAAATSATNAANSATAAAASENNAKASETAAANSAVISGSCMNIAGVHAGDAEAWAIGKRNGQLVPPTDPAYENNSLHYKEVCESIAGSLVSVLKPKGTCLFVNLPTIADSQPGDTWNIEDEFTTTSDFREGAGRLVEAGANVYLTIDNKWDVLAGTTSDYIGATASAAAVHGLLPAAQAGDQDKVFKGDGKWHELDAVPSALIENAIAPIENSNIATNNYVRGFQFIKDNYLCVALTNISAGDTLVLDTNYTYADDVTEQLYETNVNINRNVQNLIAQIEHESTAENAYDVGDQFVYGGVLCKAIATINQGDTFTLGTNYQHANDIATQIKGVSGRVVQIDIVERNGVYGYIDSGGHFVDFKSQADIDAAVAAARVGTATAADVKAGVTFTNSTASGLTGTFAAQEKTVTAGTSAASVTPDSGKYLSKVTYNPTPSQTKSASPSTSAQTISPDSGKLLSSVSISAISPQKSNGTYINSSGIDSTAPYVYIPYGWYPQYSGKPGYSYVYMTAAQAQALHKHTATYTPTANSSASDMGEKHNYRYVDTRTVYNLGSSAGLASGYTTVAKVADTGSSGNTVSFSVANGHYYLAAGFNYQPLTVTSGGTKIASATINTYFYFMVVKTTSTTLKITHHGVINSNVASGWVLIRLY